LLTFFLIKRHKHTPSALGFLPSQLMSLYLGVFPPFTRQL
jgi:hypothetical protein